jgi:DNA-binding CsgD family transcriptional regulator
MPTGEKDLNAEQQRLLELLSGGLSLEEVAKILRFSRRTAERRVAEARRILGAETTAEAVARARCRTIVPSAVVTPRERQVLEAVAAGHRDTAIAAELGIAPSTVAALLRSAMAKLGARTRVEAVARLAGINDEP